MSLPWFCHGASLLILPPTGSSAPLPDSCPLKGRKAHFSLLLFFLTLK